MRLGASATLGKVLLCLLQQVLLSRSSVTGTRLERPLTVQDGTLSPRYISIQQPGGDLLMHRMQPEIQEAQTPPKTPPKTPAKTPRTTPKTSPKRGNSPILKPSPKGPSPSGMKGATGGRKVSFADLGQAALSRGPSSRRTRRTTSHGKTPGSSPDETIWLSTSASNSGRIKSFSSDTSLPNFSPYSPPAKGFMGRLKKKLSRNVCCGGSQKSSSDKAGKEMSVWSNIKQMARWK